MLYSMRASQQETTGFSPYLVMYGRHPPSLAGRQLAAQATDAQQKLDARRGVNQGLHQAMQANVSKAQAKQERQVKERNKNRQQHNTTRKRRSFVQAGRPGQDQGPQEDGAGFGGQLGGALPRGGGPPGCGGGAGWQDCQGRGGVVAGEQLQDVCPY